MMSGAGQIVVHVSFVFLVCSTGGKVQCRCESVVCARTRGHFAIAKAMYQCI